MVAEYENGSDEFWMSLAYQQAQLAWDKQEIPVGAVLVKDGKLIATGHNMPISLHDPSGHAEIVCLREGGRALSNYRLVDTTLYITLEPCVMCAGAIVHARVSRLVFGASDRKTGAAGSVINLFEHSSMNHQVLLQGGVLAEQCANLLSDFFTMRRKEKKATKASTVLIR